ncbi:MAG: rRNA maturation RNase YbeY [Rectinemataceae bacterium]|nr:rRNA maturation RNase YbeY [Rectinemataceae bacterium]
MNSVDTGFHDIAEPEWLDRAESFSQRVLSGFGVDNRDLSILFCGDAFIQMLNREYRNRDEPTDVLSFEQGGEYTDESGQKRILAGDIVISLEALSRNAEEFAVPYDDELKRLIVHGILHLSGYDHEDNDTTRPMLVLQEEIMSAHASSRIS